MDTKPNELEKDEHLEKEYQEMLQQEQGVIEPEPKEEEVKPDEPEKPSEEVNPTEPEAETKEAEAEKETEGEEPPKEETKPEKEAEPRQRPENYIPIPKYRSEKEQWKQREEELTKEIEKLKTAADKAPEGSKEQTDKIKGWSEKHGMSEDAARDLLNIVREEATPKDVLLKLSALEAKSKEEAEQSYFQKEFEDYLPNLKKDYPNATSEQIEEVKGEMDKIAHTDKYSKLSLDEVFALSKSSFDSLLASKTGVKGVESSKVGSGAPKKTTASQFKPDKDGNYDFTELHAMGDGEEKNNLISDLEAEAYVKYVDDLASREGTEVKRGGRTVNLK